jgi:sterol desaturase/sphingolipid hydroxylase (fatty acid hydroxylase superfamily)
VAYAGRTVATGGPSATFVLHTSRRHVTLGAVGNVDVADAHQHSGLLLEGLVRYGFLPFMLVAVNGSAVWAASAGAPKWQLVALVVLAVMASFAAEQVAPCVEDWNRPRGDGPRDAAHALVNEVLQIGSLLTLPVYVSVLAIEGAWPTSLPFVVQVLGSVVVVDAGITIAHWWSHRSKPLWRLHSVHHSVERFYGLNGLMKHPLHQLFETMIATAPLVLLGLPTDVATAVVVMVSVQLLVQHSNVDYALGPLDRALAVNRVHRFHHLRWPGVGDVNFGLFLTVWDRLLGTYVRDPDARFDSSVLGIAAEPDYPIGYLDQLRRPFQPYRPQAVHVPEVWRR